VDPVVDKRGSIPNPQRWNRYAYVTNNPARYVDPDGRFVIVLAPLVPVAAEAAVWTIGVATAAVVGWAAAKMHKKDDAEAKPDEPPAPRGLDDILNDDEIFERWLNHKFPKDRPYSVDDAGKNWDKIVESGREPRRDDGHAGRGWDVPHINVEGANVHIPVVPEFVR
jgi:hypothetical protein